jgi:hypothetical protein
VTRQAVSKIVKTKKIPLHGRDKLIDPAEADFLIDGARERLNEPAPAPIGGDAPAARSQSDSLTAARTEEIRYRAKTAQLVYQQRVGDLLPRAGVVEAAQKCAATLIETYEDIVRHAAELVAVAAKDGEAGIRIRLRAIVRELRGQAAEAFAELATDSIAAGSAAAEAIGAEVEASETDE